MSVQVSKFLNLCLIIILAVAFSATPVIISAMAQQTAAAVDWSPVNKAFGLAGDVKQDGVVKYSIPRNLTVTLDGVRLAPGSDMSHDFEFMRTNGGAMMIGELALTEDEIPAVREKLARANISMTALHEHLLHESPLILWLHVQGNGDPVRMATGIRDIVTSLRSEGVAAVDTQAAGLDSARLDSIMEAKGESGEGVYAYSIPRSDVTLMDGFIMPVEMDLSSEISFQPLGGGTALTIAELPLEAGEVEPVLRSLSSGGFEVTALHSHMLTEEPRLFYLHGWKKGDAAENAKALSSALEMTNRAK